MKAGFSGLGLNVAPALLQSDKHGSHDETRRRTSWGDWFERKKKTKEAVACSSTGKRAGLQPQTVTSDFASNSKVTLKLSQFPNLGSINVMIKSNHIKGGLRTASIIRHDSHISSNLG